MRIRKAFVSTVVVTGLAFCTLSACTPNQSSSPAGASEDESGNEPVITVAGFDANPTVDLSPCGAEVAQTDEGALVQRTPDDDNSAVYTNPPDAPSYNVEILNADNRGCYACHIDLAETVANMDYDHMDLRGEWSMQMQVSDCMSCHETNYYMTTLFTFGELIHGLHSDVQDAQCMTCHASSDTYSGDKWNGFQGNEGGLRLWDNVKYDLLRGITQHDQIEGTFDYDQDLVSAKLFSANWIAWPSDADRYYTKVEDDAPRTEQMLRDWEINVIDTDGTTQTFTMGELMDEFESVTDVRTMQCTINSTNTGMISNVKVEGIPLRDLLTKAGYDPETIPSLKILDPDQAAINWDGYPFPFIDQADHPDLLVYKVNDELLSWENGFPVVNWMPTTSYAGADVKQVTNIYIDPEERELSPHDPTIGVFYLKDGQTTTVRACFRWPGLTGGIVPLSPSTS